MLRNLKQAAYELRLDVLEMGPYWREYVLHGYPNDPMW